MESGDRRGMSDRKFEEQTGEKPAFKAAFEETFKVIPWSEAIAAAPFLPPADRDLSSEEFAKGVADLMSDDLPVRIGEAPAWNANLDGIPTDRDVWAYVMEWDGEDTFALVRGRREGRGEDAYFGDHDIRDVVAWIDVEERPVFSLALVKAGVAALERLERLGNGHMAEDWLHREALRAVVDGHPDAQAIAAAALESRAVKFTRYYS